MTKPASARPPTMGPRIINSHHGVAPGFVNGRGAQLLMMLAMPLLACSAKVTGGAYPSGGDPQGTGAGNGTVTGSGSSSGKGTGGNTATTGTGATTGSGGSTTVASCTGTTPALAAPRIWRLTHTQMANTLRDRFNYVPPAITSFPIETRFDGFANQASALVVSPLLADSYYAASEQLATQAITAPATFGITCAIANIATGTCLTSFINTFGEKMWRRPVTDAERTKLTALYTTAAGQGDGPTGGVKAVVQSFFLSPNFIHRSELGTVLTAGMTTPLTDFEIASALSYTLWDTAPDDALMAQAKAGKLRDKATLASEAKRLFGVTDRASSAMHHFLQQWMYIENLPQADKDTAMFPQGTLDVAADLMEENRLFMNSVLFDAGGDRTFKTLFTASYGFVNSRTAAVYGLKGVTGTALARRDLDATQRRGLFTLPSFMWAHGNTNGTPLVSRGSYFRNQVICDRVPPPPGGVQQLAVFAGDDATGREKFTLHSQPACAACHKLFDSIGFAMESYDAIGQFRLTDKNKMIDPTGSIPLPSTAGGADLSFSNFVDLIDKLSQRPDVYNCFSTQYLTYASGLGIDQIDPCQRQALAADFAKANYKVDSLVLSVVGSPNFLDRKN